MISANVKAGTITHQRKSESHYHTAKTQKEQREERKQKPRMERDGWVARKV